MLLFLFCNGRAIRDQQRRRESKTSARNSHQLFLLQPLIFFSHSVTSSIFNTDSIFIQTTFQRDADEKEEERRALRLWRKIKPIFWDRWDSNPRRATASKKVFRNRIVRRCRNKKSTSLSPERHKELKTECFFSCGGKKKKKEERNQSAERMKDLRAQLKQILESGRQRESESESEREREREKK